jgi:uracil-DNA glycosylase
VDERAQLLADIRENILFLKELGVTSMDANLPELSNSQELHAPSAVEAISSTPAQQPVVEVAPGVKPEPPRRRGGSRLASLPSLTSRKSAAFFDKYNPGDDVIAPARIGKNKPASAADTAKSPSHETLKAIHAEIGPDCTRCPLGTLGRKQVVNSVGNPSARLMFVGEAPGASEDDIGQPFVGRAGQLLTDIIEKGLQIPREDVFIGNINRCRPPGNRPPEPDESAVCKPFLLREIAIVKPKVIVVLGKTAAHNLLETKVPISSLRGKFHEYMGVKVMPTFHPSYLLRDPHKKREVWEDMKMVRDYLASK